MRVSFSYFDVKGRDGRKAFWAGWVTHLLLSLAMIVLFLVVDGARPGGTAVLALLGMRLLLIGPQMSLYVRRLRDAGQPGWWALFLPGVYAVMGYVCWHMAQPAADFALECKQTGYDDCGDAGAFTLMAVLAGLGPLTGFPGPFSLLFAIAVGAAKSKRPSGG